jgi:predicted ATP-dependent serine protease
MSVTMETPHDLQSSRPARLPTQVPGLDRVLRGSIPRDSVLLVASAPGTGKTTLGNQLAFRHAAAGGTALIVTLMAETHNRMLQKIRRQRLGVKGADSGSKRGSPSSNRLINGLAPDILASPELTFPIIAVD